MFIFFRTAMETLGRAGLYNKGSSVSVRFELFFYVNCNLKVS